MPPVVALASKGGQPERVAAVLRRSPPLMTALFAAREVAAPDWLVSAGAVRDAVGDALHDRAPTHVPRDVDLSFFDPSDLTRSRDEEVEGALRRQAPELPWEAKNQAAVHTWYATRFGVVVPPFASTAEAIATFPEVASCVGVRLLADDDLLVVAPHGLDDLLNGICRHNPTRVSARFYSRRQAEKGWPARWPRVRYLKPASSPSDSGLAGPRERLTRRQSRSAHGVQSRGMGTRPGRESDDELLRAARRDPNAFGEFYLRHEEQVVRYFMTRVGDAEVAADLTAETFAAALAGLSRFRAGRGPAAAWLFGIARNTLAMSRRRGQVDARARARMGMPPLELTDDLVERIDALGGPALELVCDLPPHQRDAVRARVIDERDYDEIAKDLRCSEAVVRKRVSRGLARMREELGES